MTEPQYNSCWSRTTGEFYLWAIYDGFTKLAHISPEGYSTNLGRYLRVGEHIVYHGTREEALSEADFNANYLVW